MAKKERIPKGDKVTISGLRIKPVIRTQSRRGKHGKRFYVTIIAAPNTHIKYEAQQEHSP